MQVRFWGVRGATPTPNRKNLRYGGNTPCIELRTPKGGLFIIDCGTGFRMLGKALEKEYGRRSIQARVFVSHYHWDHIQGIPFFTPLYNERNRFLFHANPFRAESIRAALEGQMADPYFPVDMSVMHSQRHFVAMEEEDHVHFDDVVFSSLQLFHPQGCLGFRFEVGGKVFVYASDTEPGDRQGDENVRRLADGADVLVYDAQYLPREMKRYQGWGHSHWKEGVRIAQECGVGKLILFHHDPDRDDPQMDALVRTARDHFGNVVGAREGLTLKL